MLPSNNLDSRTLQRIALVDLGKQPTEQYDTRLLRFSAFAPLSGHMHSSGRYFPLQIVLQNRYQSWPHFPAAFHWRYVAIVRVSTRGQCPNCCRNCLWACGLQLRWPQKCECENMRSGTASMSHPLPTRARPSSVRPPPSCTSTPPSTGRRRHSIPMTRSSPIPMCEPTVHR